MSEEHRTLSFYSGEEGGGGGREGEGREGGEGESEKYMITCTHAGILHMYTC